MGKKSKKVKCPECGSREITAQRRGFGMGKAIVGGVTLGALGILAGAHGNKKIIITCLACGHEWKAGA